MDDLKEESRMSVAGIIREIIQNNPPITYLSLYRFSDDKDRDESAGDIIL